MTVTRWLTLALALAVFAVLLTVAALVLFILGAIGGETLFDSHYAAGAWCLVWGRVLDDLCDKADAKATVLELAA